MTPAFVYLVYEAGNFRLALDTSVALRASGLGTPVLFSPYWLPDTARYIELAREQGIAYVHEATALGGLADPLAQLQASGFAPAQSAAHASPLPVLAVGVRARIGSWLLRQRREEVAQWETHYRARTDVAVQFLAAAGARALVLPEDNVERDSACWCVAMHARGGRVAVISYGSISRHEAAVAYWDSPDHAVKSPADAAFGVLFPRWKMVYKDRSLLRLPAPRALAMERLGLAPRDPWVVNSGDGSDAIAVESPFMRDLFARHGIPARKIHPIGHAGLDRLAESVRGRDAVRARWREEQGYDPAQSIVICAMPPDQYPALPAAGFASYVALVDGWLDALARLRPAFFPLVSPHPNISPAMRAHIEAAGFPVLDGGVANWLPACDLYVASVSGTIKWALACGKPVVNFDCYDYRHGDFDDIAEIVNVGTYPEFCAALERFTDPGYLRARALAAGAVSAAFGALDGRSGERLAALMRDDPRA